MGIREGVIKGGRPIACAGPQLLAHQIVSLLNERYSNAEVPVLIIYLVRNIRHSANNLVG